MFSPAIYCLPQYRPSVLLRCEVHLPRGWLRPRSFGTAARKRMALLMVFSGDCGMATSVAAGIRAILCSAESVAASCPGVEPSPPISTVPAPVAALRPRLQAVCPGRIAVQRSGQPDATFLNFLQFCRGPFRRAVKFILLFPVLDRFCSIACSRDFIASAWAGLLTCPPANAIRPPRIRARNFAGEIRLHRNTIFRIGNVFACTNPQASFRTSPAAVLIP